MTRKDQKTALGTSLKAEKQAVKNRFSKAEAILAKRTTAAATIEPASNTGRVIRDSFTMPATDYDLISALKKRCLKAGVSVNKSELLRAGLNVLDKMSEKGLLEAIEELTKVKTGRPPANE